VRRLHLQPVTGDRRQAARGRSAPLCKPPRDESADNHYHYLYYSKEWQCEGAVLHL
jgi:hypothetical protein